MLPASITSPTLMMWRRPIRRAGPTTRTETDRAGVNIKYDINDTFLLRSAYLYKKDRRDFIITYPINTPTGWTMYAPGKTPPFDTESQGAYTYLDAAFNTGAVKHKLTVGGSWDTFKEVLHINSYIIFDLGLRYTTEVLDRLTTFNLYVSNLTNEDYWASEWQLGLPRNIAFPLRAEF